MDTGSASRLASVKGVQVTGTTDPPASVSPPLGESRVELVAAGATVSTVNVNGPRAALCPPRRSRPMTLQEWGPSPRGPTCTTLVPVGTTELPSTKAPPSTANEARPTSPASGAAATPERIGLLVE